MFNADAHVIFFLKFECDAFQQFWRSGNALVFVIGRRGQEALDFRDRGRGRAIIHDTLAERMAPGCARINSAITGMTGV